MEPTGRRGTMTPPPQEKPSTSTKEPSLEATGSWLGADIAKEDASAQTAMSAPPPLGDTRIQDRKSNLSSAANSLPLPASLAHRASELQDILTHKRPIPHGSPWCSPIDVSEVEMILSKQSAPEDNFLLAEKFCDLALHYYHTGEKEKGLSYLSKAMEKKPQRVEDIITLWRLSMEVDQCTRQREPLKRLQQIEQQLQALSNRNISQASWILALLHQGLLEGFELIANPQQSIYLFFQSFQQMLTLPFIQTQSFAILPPRSAFSVADSVFHIPALDFSQFSELSRQFRPLTLMSALSLRDSFGFYRTSQIQASTLRTQYQKLCPTEFVPIVYWATSLAILIGLESPSKNRLAMLAPDKIIGNLACFTQSSKYYSEYERATSHIHAALLSRHSRNAAQNKPVWSAQHFAAAHCLGEAFGQLKDTICTLHKHRQYLLAASCYNHQAELLEKHGEKELAEIARGNALRNEALERGMCSLQQMSIDELKAFIEGEDSVKASEDSANKRSPHQRKKKNGSLPNTQRKKVSGDSLAEATTAMSSSTVTHEPVTAPSETIAAKALAKDPALLVSSRWPNSVPKTIYIADCRRENGLYDDAHYLLQKTLKQLQDESLPGRERLHEEIAWTHIHASGDPAQFKNLPTEKTKEQIRMTALQSLKQAEDHIRQSLSIKLRTPVEELPVKHKDLIDFTFQKAQETIQELPEQKDKEDYLWGLRCMFSSLGHIYSNKMIYLGKAKKKSSQLIYQDFYKAKEIESLA